jgi:aspartyl-tRNA(Asn)/glutamyl-tRNA(Gln) amidotransferase subunit A
MVSGVQQCEAHWLGAGEIAASYAARQLSPVELLESLLARIAAIDPQLNVFTRLDADFAMDAARQAEREIAAGRCRGKLHGVPVGIKDIFDVAGLPTTCNSKLRLDHRATADAHVVSRLRAAGAIIVGKLGTHEFAIGGPAFDLPFPPPRNPWNRDHHPGGSSSGSGAGLAAGLFPLALGSDTGGSIRHPASASGIAGLKPSYGLVSRAGVAPLSFTLDHVGPMARSAADLALLLNVIAGHDPQDPGSVAAARYDFGSELHLGIRGLRIGFVRHFHEGDLHADAEVIAALEQVAAVLSADGALVRTVVLPPLAEFAEVCRIILGAEAWPLHAQHLRSRPEDYGHLTRDRLMDGAGMSAEDYVRARCSRHRLIAAVDEVFHEVDLLLTASALAPPCRIDDPEMLAHTHGLQAWRPFNVTGHPAVVIMAGLSKAGLPLSAQLVGRALGEARVLRAAACYEQSTDWRSRRPPSLDG